MKIYSVIPSDLPPTALTIGTFDGVHLGHQNLLKRLRAVSSHTTVVTFSNHPFEILKPKEAPTLLTPLPQKLALLEQHQVDVVIALPFTQEFASIPYDTFLSFFPLTHLILGKESVLGKNREGTPENLFRLSQARGFTVEYVEKAMKDGAPISSRLIRMLIASNDYETASQLLGRTYIKESHV